MGLESKCLVFRFAANFSYCLSFMRKQHSCVFDFVSLTQMGTTQHGRRLGIVGLIHKQQVQTLYTASESLINTLESMWLMQNSQVNTSKNASPMPSVVQ
jgi:hypothetical protein